MKDRKCSLYCQTGGGTTSNGSQITGGKLRGRSPGGNYPGEFTGGNHRGSSPASGTNMHATGATCMSVCHCTNWRLRRLFDY